LNLLDFLGRRDYDTSMYELSLSKKEKADLEMRHRETRNVHESDRIKAILLRSEGWSVSDIAQALRVHESTITRHTADYLQKQKLSYSKGGSKSYLSDEQTNQLVEHLTENLYHHTHEIVVYIQHQWGITYTVSGLNKWLHKNNFSYKKPKGRPYKADSEKQADFIKKYEKLKSSLTPEETVLFMDSVHPTQATKISYGWIPKGKTHEVSTTASRTRINLIGALSLDKIEDTVVADYETINGKSITNFFDKLRKQYSIENRLHVILDCAGYHRSDEVKKKAESLNMVLHYLPPYSPNLNPIERLWKVMNENVRNNKFFKSAKDFKEQIKGFFKDTLPQIGSDLSGRINDNFQELKPAN
jgi:transposase